MPFNLPLSAALRKARWKVKIREKETREPPHVTILRGTEAWRIDLRTGQFMDDYPDPSLVPSEIVTFIRDDANWNTLCEQWDLKYPANPVQGPANQEDEG